MHYITSYPVLIKYNSFACYYATATDNLIKAFQLAIVAITTSNNCMAGKYNKMFVTYTSTHMPSCTTLTSQRCHGCTVVETLSWVCWSREARLRRAFLLVLYIMELRHSIFLGAFRILRGVPYS